MKAKLCLIYNQVYDGFYDFGLCRVTWVMSTKFGPSEGTDKGTVNCLMKSDSSETQKTFNPCLWSTCTDLESCWFSCGSQLNLHTRFVFFGLGLQPVITCKDQTIKLLPNRATSPTGGGCPAQSL